MEQLRCTTSLSLISLVCFNVVKYSTGKSVAVDLNLTPEWQAEITQRASDYGNLSLFCRDSNNHLIFVFETTKTCTIANFRS